MEKNTENFLRREPSIEDKSDEEIFQNYMEDLELLPEDFDKKILDIESRSAKFAKWAKEHNVSSEIYSLEPEQEFQEKTKSVKGRAENIPFQNEAFDLVISNCSIPNELSGKNPKTLKEKVRSSLIEMMRVVKPGGEIRLGRVLYKSQQERGKMIDDVLNELCEKYDAEIEKISQPLADIYKYDANHKPVKLLAQVYFIKIRKPIKKNKL